MGNLFRKAEQYIQPVQSNEVFVEIGTARGGEGSTHYFAELAHNRGTVLHSVDVDNREHIFRYIRNGVIGHCAPGSEWAKNIFPTLNKTIAFLYLDNYDYNYGINDTSTYIEDQKTEYLTKYNIELNNTDCEVEHLKQMIALLPYMSKNGIVICDDTYLFNDCWIGKCGAVVPYLLAHDFKIAEIEEISGSSYGVILCRN